ncbi:MAG: phosphoserine phosphatase SerB [Pseudomonadota bacterium]
MTDKTSLDCVAVAVAPVSVGFMALGQRLEQAVGESGVRPVGRVRLLGAEERWAAVEVDVSVPKARLAEVQASLESAFEGEADLALIPSAGRRKRLLISDMDSTIIQQECLDELAAFAGLKDEIAAITARAMAGELDFEAALTERVGMLAGLPVSTIEQCYEEKIDLMPGARTLTATMKANGADCILVSGGFTSFTSRVAEAAGFTAHRGNTLINDGETLTGEVTRPILGREAKLQALDEFAGAAGFPRPDVLAMGDGANDLAMIEAAGLGLAVHAKPIVAAASDAAISVTDLTTALYFQGYSDSEIVWSE